MIACAERRSKSPGRSDSAPEVGQGVLLGEDGQSGDLAFLASGKLCSTLQKQFSICVDFTWNK